MCTGVEIALLAATAVSAVGTLEAGQQQARMAEYNARVAEQGAAAAAGEKATYDEQIHREQVRKILSQQRALYGKSGVDMTTGSPLLVMEDTAKTGELDALAIRYGGEVEAARARSGANLSRMQGRTAQTTSYYQAGTTLLSGGAQAYGNFKKSQLSTRPIILKSGG